MTWDFVVSANTEGVILYIHSWREIIAADGKPVDPQTFLGLRLWDGAVPGTDIDYRKEFYRCVREGVTTKASLTGAMTGMTYASSFTPVLSRPGFPQAYVAGVIVRTKQTKGEP